MQRKATAQWHGGLKDGAGQLTTDSKAIANVPYNFAKRFENETGTNPEELIAAAHAGCYAMALSGTLGKTGHKAEDIRTIATVTLEPKDGAPTVTGIHLDVTARVPNIDDAAFQSAAEETRANCPISRLLIPGTKVTMNARLESGAGVR